MYVYNIYIKKKYINRQVEVWVFDFVRSSVDT